MTQDKRSEAVALCSPAGLATGLAAAPLTSPAITSYRALSGREPADLVRVPGTSSARAPTKLASSAAVARALAGAHTGLWDWDLKTGEVSVSSQSRDFRCADGEEVGPHVEAWCRRIHPDDRERVALTWTAHLRGVTPQWECEYRMLRSAGTYRWVLTRATCVRDADGTPLRLAGSVVDISRRKAAHEISRRHRAELQHAFRQTELGEIASGIGHELNQPLAAIVNFAKGCALRLRSGKANQAELLVAVERIAQEAMRAGAIIRDLRQRTRTTEPCSAAVDLNALIRALSEMAGAQISLQGARLQLDLADLPSVHADPTQVEVVLLNLVRNGLDAMQAKTEGNRDLTIQTRLATPEQVEVTVCDTGAPQPMAARDQWVDPFFSTRPDGIGIGLSLSRSIIEAHGGRLWLTDNDEGGTTCHFTLCVVNRARKS